MYRSARHNVIISSPQRRSVDRAVENGNRRQYFIDDVRRPADGSSRTVAEMKTQPRGDGRSFIWDIMSCLVDGSCKADEPDREPVRSDDRKPRRPMSIADGGHREHHHLQQPQPYHSHHRQRPTTAIDDIDRFLLLQLHGRRVGARTESGDGRRPDGEDYDDAALRNVGATRTLPMTLFGHRQACRRREVEETRCLNGGQCFAVEFHGGLRRSGCSCIPSWSGLRCEQRYVDPNQWGFQRADDSIKMAAVGNSTAFLVLMLFLVWLLQYLVTRRKKTQGKQRGHTVDTHRDHVTELYGRTTLDGANELVNMDGCFLDENYLKPRSAGEQPNRAMNKVGSIESVGLLHRTSATVSLILSSSPSSQRQPTITEGTSVGRQSSPAANFKRNGGTVDVMQSFKSAANNCYVAGFV